MKEATATKLKLLQATQKQFRKLSVQPGLRLSNYLRVGRKMANFQLFFQSVRAKDFSAPLYIVAECILECETCWCITEAVGFKRLIID